MAVALKGPITRLNAACPYFTMFPLDFPLAALATARPEALVLDPFCGRGTTVFAARLLGLPVVGIDVNPVAVAIAEAKLADGDALRVAALARNLIHGHRGASRPHGEFWELAYAARTLGDVCALRAGLLEAANTDDAKLLRAISLGALHGPRGKVARSYFSNQMPRTYATKPTGAVRYWRRNRLVPEELDIAEIIRTRADRLLAARAPRGEGRVLLGDARTILPRLRSRFTHVVCSPPYLGMRSYLPDQWLRWWFLGGPAAVDYRLPGQIATAEPAALVTELGKTWSAVARRCVLNAELTVRFGALPSLRLEPSDLIAQSLRASGAAWEIVEERPAGNPRVGRRQAEQFHSAMDDFQLEVDVTAALRE